MSDASPLNLLGLARSEIGRAVPVPGTDLAVMALTETTPETRAEPLWLLLLDGDLIIDLPYGDFRHLRAGDSVTLPAAAITFEPVEPAVILRRG